MLRNDFAYADNLSITYKTKAKDVSVALRNARARLLEDRLTESPYVHITVEQTGTLINDFTDEWNVTFDGVMEYVS